MSCEGSFLSWSLRSQVVLLKVVSSVTWLSVALIQNLCLASLSQSSLSSQPAHVCGAHTMAETTEATVSAVECVHVLLLSGISHGIS